MKLVQLRERPPLTDVAGRLENLAKQILVGNVPADVVVVITADEERRVRTYAFGSVGKVSDTVGVVQMALHELLTSVTHAAPDVPPKTST